MVVMVAMTVLLVVSVDMMVVVLMKVLVLIVVTDSPRVDERPSGAHGDGRRG